MRVSELKRSMDAQFSDLAQSTDAQFTGVAAQFANIDAQFANIDAQFANVGAQFANVDAQFNNVGAQFARIDARFEELDERLRRHFTVLTEDLRTDIRRVAERLESLMHVVVSMQQERSLVVGALDNHEVRIQALERPRR